jgi:AsmA-like protein
VFIGISGILSSAGDFRGVLQTIVVDGTTETPDFKLGRGARALHLSTQFHAVVDGTNGNTYLQPVNAQFLNSSVVATGEVTGKPAVQGKSISLDVEIRISRMQDLLELATASRQPMVAGSLAARAKLLIPPGQQVVLDKMELSGSFNARNARFSGDKVKITLDSLSRRAQGGSQDQTIQGVPAQLSGRFTLSNANLSFSSFQFEVPGVVAKVKGWYGLRSEQIDFTGDVRCRHAYPTPCPALSESCSNLSIRCSQGTAPEPTYPSTLRERGTNRRSSST